MRAGGGDASGAVDVVHGNIRGGSTVQELTDDGQCMLNGEERDLLKFASPSVLGAPQLIIAENDKELSSKRAPRMKLSVAQL